MDFYTRRYASISPRSLKYLVMAILTKKVSMILRIFFLPIGGAFGALLSPAFFSDQLMQFHEAL
jgi:hypothetical protein